MPLPRAYASLIAPLLPACGAPTVVCFRALHCSASPCCRGLRPSHHPLHLRKLCVPEIRVAERLAGINQGTANRVSEVVFRTRTMVNAVFSASRRSALKRQKLSAQSVVIEERCSP